MPTKKRIVAIVLIILMLATSLYGVLAVLIK